MFLEISDIAKRFGSFNALKGVSLSVEPGTFLALLGPSGSGKTTLLRILGGLAFADAGSVKFEGLDWLSIPARERRAGFVFQNYALFKHMTVARNISFGLDVRARHERPSRAQIDARVEELLSLVQLDGLGGRYPAQLSGGQRQRVALARALAIAPRMLLLDEPFGALDAKVRKDLRRWLRGLHEKTGVTTIFVTHDQEEALDLADQVAIMNEGRIDQAGTPGDVYENPRTAFVAEFLGGANVLEGMSEAGEVNVEGHVLAHRYSEVGTGPVRVYVRPHDIDIEETERRGIQGTVCGRLGMGPLVRYDIALRGGRIIEAVLPHGAQGAQPGDRVSLRPKRAFVFPHTHISRRLPAEMRNVTSLHVVKR
ncbi:MAG: sulfate/molybdate ABC transporter ATP-binding protein [Alphaproteobacteria bacterium]|nr:sulfate/molybdate ABC transporter ATP-binding protein [Alphaproteobacteria bacterium]